MLEEKLKSKWKQSTLANVSISSQLIVRTQKTIFQVAMVTTIRLEHFHQIYFFERSRKTPWVSWIPWGILYISRKPGQKSMRCVYEQPVPLSRSTLPNPYTFPNKLLLFHKSRKRRDEHWEASFRTHTWTRRPSLICNGKLTRIKGISENSVLHSMVFIQWWILLSLKWSLGSPANCWLWVQLMSPAEHTIASLQCISGLVEVHELLVHLSTQPPPEPNTRYASRVPTTKNRNMWTTVFVIPLQIQIYHTKKKIPAILAKF